MASCPAFGQRPDTPEIYRSGQAATTPSDTQRRPVTPSDAQRVRWPRYEPHPKYLVSHPPDPQKILENCNNSTRFFCQFVPSNQVDRMRSALPCSKQQQKKSSKNELFTRPEPIRPNPIDFLVFQWIKITKLVFKLVFLAPIHRDENVNESNWEYFEQHLKILQIVSIKTTVQNGPIRNAALIFD